MAETLRRQVNIFVDSGQADAAYKRLSQSETKYRLEIEKRKKSGSDTAELEAKLAKTIEQKQRVEKKMTGELSLSYKDLTNAVRKLRMEHSLMSEQDPGYANITRQLQEGEEQLKKYKLSLTSVSQGWKNMLDQAKGVAVGVLIGNSVQAAVETGIGAVRTIVQGSRDAAIARQQMIGELSAITGAVGDDLEYLKKASKDLSSIQIEENKAITNSANEILEAFKLVASGRSELLENLPALKAVTKEVLVLSKASGLDLVQSTEAVIASLNQFDLASSEARKAINVLAAGSKVGAAEIPQLAESLSVVGATAKNSNQTLESTVAAIEVLSQKNIKGAEAGTALRNVLLRLQKAQLGMSDGTFNLNEALDEAAAKYTTVNELQELFGEHAITAGQILIANRGTLEKWTEEVTGTNLAYEQAVVQVIELEEAQKKYERGVKSLQTSIGQGLTPIFITLYEWGFKLTQAFRDLPGILERNREWIIAVATAYLLYYRNALQAIIAVNAESAATIAANTVKRARLALLAAETVMYQTAGVAIMLLTGRMKVAELATLAWNAATRANPLGILITALGAASAALIVYSKNTKEALELERQKRDLSISLADANKANSEAIENLNIQISNYNQLSVEQRKQLYENLKAQLQLQRQQLENAKAQQQEIEKAAQTTTVLEDLWITTKNMVLLQGTLGAEVEKVVTAIENGSKAASEYDEQINALNDQLKQLEGNFSEIDNRVKAFDKAMAISGTTSTELEEKLRLLNIALGDTEKGTARFAQIQKEINKVKAELAKFSLPEEDNKAFEKEKERLESFKSEIQKLNEELTLASMSEDEKQLYSIKKKYDEMYAKAKTTYPALFGLMEEYYEQIKQLQAQETFNATSSIEYQAALNATAKYFQDEKLLRKQQYADGLIDRQTYQQSLLLIDLSYKSAKVQVAQDYSNSVKQADADLKVFTEESYEADLDFYIEHKESIAEIDAAQSDARIAAAEAEFEHQKMLKEKIRDLAIYSAQELLSIAGDFIALADRQDQQQFDAQKKRNEKKKEELKKNLEQGKISQQQYNAAIFDMDRQTAEREKEIKIAAFKRNKALRIAETIQTTAFGALQAYVAAQSIPPPAGQIIGAASAAAVAAFGAARLIMIQSENPPEFEYGGIEGQGITKGDRHAQGGIDLIERRTGRRRGNMEGGELILSRGFVATNPDLIDPLLEASRTRQPLANVHPAFKGRSLSINTSRAAENALFESGGLFDAVRYGTNTNRQNNSNANAEPQLNMVVIEELLRNIDTRLAMLQDKELIDYTELARTMRYVYEALEKQI